MNTVDMLVLGAGPAGLSMALRLQQLGYRVALLERSPVWPRPQIGEALTPGVKNIIDFLDASDALENLPHVAGLPTRLCWRSRTPEIVQHNDSAVVDRSVFDARFLKLLQERGVQVYQPASLISTDGSAGNWQVCFSTPAGLEHMQAQIILDAQGRQNQAASQLSLAPRLSAVWTELPEHEVPDDMAHFTQVEALEHGWLWGTRLPDQRYRLMLLADPASSRRMNVGGPEARLREACTHSQLFSSVTQSVFSTPLQMCAATPYISLNSWQDGRLKLGDAAFALDPVSSSGVEKAMRFSLQAAIAAHTYCQASDTAQQDLAREFYLQRLTEAAARHHFWTATYYQQAWCRESPFWQSRALPASMDFLAAEDFSDKNVVADELKAEVHRLARYQEPELQRNQTIQMNQIVRFHHQVHIASTLCVTGEKVERLPALQHPSLEHPVAFWENEILLPRVGVLLQNTAVSSVLGILGHSMGLQKAQRLIAWFWKRGLLEIVS